MFFPKGCEALNECYSIYRCSIYIVPIGARSRYSLRVWLDYLLSHSSGHSEVWTLSWGAVPSIAQTMCALNSTPKLTLCGYMRGVVTQVEDDRLCEKIRCHWQKCDWRQCQTDDSQFKNSRLVNNCERLCSGWRVSPGNPPLTFNRYDHCIGIFNYLWQRFTKLEK